MSKEKEGYILKAHKALKKENDQEAIEFYEMALQEDRKDVRILIKLADLYTKVHNNAKAIERLLSSIKILKKDGFRSRAVVAAKQVLELDYYCVEAHLELIDLWGQLEMYNELECQKLRLASMLKSKEDKTAKEQALLVAAQRDVADMVLDDLIFACAEGDTEAKVLLKEMKVKINGALNKSKK